MSFGFEQRTTVREEPMEKTKSYAISKQVVLEAFQKVKANQGVAGIDCRRRPSSRGYGVIECPIPRLRQLESEA